MPKHLRILLLVFAGLIFSVHGTSCASTTENQLKLGVQLEPPGLDPTMGAAASIREVAFQTIFESLVQLGPDGQILPQLARDWTISADGLHYLFRLRHGIRFHDGSAFDASSVKFSLERARSPNSKNAQTQAFGLIEDVRIKASDEIEIVLKRRFSGFLPVLAYGDGAMVSPTSADANNNNPVGTGPFRFDYWRRGDSVRLVRQNNYWGQTPQIEAVTFKFISDPQAAFNALQAGDIDGFAGFPAPEMIQRLSDNPGFSVYTGEATGKAILALNNARAPFQDLRVRQAISHAVNRSELISGAMFGFGRPIGSHYGTMDEAYIDLSNTYPFDPERARRLLGDAGIMPGRILHLALPPPSYARRTGEVIAQQLGRIGISVKIEQMEWAVWLDQVFTRHDFDMTIVAHVEPMDYDIYGRSNYYFGYHSDNFNHALVRVDQSVDPGERRAGLQDIQTILARDAVNVFLFQLPALGVFRSDIKDIWAPTPTRAINLTQARFDHRSAARNFSETASGKIGGSLSQPVIWMIAVAAMLGAGNFLRRYFTMRQLADRLGVLLLTLLGASVVIFALVQLAPGDPARQMLGIGADPSAIQALRRDLGLDQPVFGRFFSWIAGMVIGDFGTSYAYRVPVLELVGERLLLSLPLALMALAISTASAFCLALLSAGWPDRVLGRWLDRLVQGVSLGMVAVPNFYMGMILILILALNLGMFPASGFPGWDRGFGPGLRALILPALALGLPQGALLTRILREELRRIATSDFIRTARAKGISRGGLLLGHILPNAALGVVTVMGLQFSFLLAGTILVENVFALPGLGRLAYLAVGQRDLPLLQSLSLLLVASVVVVSFVVDLLAQILDPRLRIRDIT